VVTTRDGTVLTCIPHATGGLLTPVHWRWLLIDRAGAQYVGPAINDDPALGSLPQRVSEWWEAHQELRRVRMTLIGSDPATAER
jgi:hypothetical protein